jgi:sialic acid synthase SpsE
MRYTSELKINKTPISISSPTYFIADVASNHDGDLSRAKDLIYLAKDAGANAVKFQHFTAEKIVSDVGFKALNAQSSHQSKWKDSVFNIYKKYECNKKWTQELVETSKKANIDFFTSPYDIETVNELDQYLPAYKIGSGDITWTQILEEIAQKQKPVILSTGASSIEDVQRAVSTILKYNKNIALLQCNTNYTNSKENFRHINLNVLKTFSTIYPGMILGLSDHTSTLSTVLGSIALGARIIEKHFTDDNNRIGPDHNFALNPKSWKEMVERSRELEYSLGDGIKRVEENEKETVILQRRSIRAAKSLKLGTKITPNHLEALRPATKTGLPPYEINKILGKTIKSPKLYGSEITKEDLEQ